VLSDEKGSEADEAGSPSSPQIDDDLESISRPSAHSSVDLDAASETDDEELRADPLPRGRVPAVVTRPITLTLTLTLTLART